MLDAEVREKFKEFQKRTGKYDYLDIDDVRFEKKKIDDVVSEFIKGSTPKYSPDATDYVVIKSGQARGNYNEFNFKKRAYLDLSKVKTIKTLQKGDILINTTGVGTAGRVTLFDLDGNYVSDSHITTLRYDLNIYSKFYLLYFFVNFGFKRLESMAEGTGGQIELSMEMVKKIDIPIPKDLDRAYTSFKIQEAIVAFLEASFEKNKRIKENIDKRYDLFRCLDKVLIPSTFIKDYVKVAFGRYAKENDIGFIIMDVDFEIKRIHADNQDDVICKKRMGFTPKTSSTGTINWFLVKDLSQVKGLYIDVPNSLKKTTVDFIKQQVDKNNTGKSEKLIPIKKGDILISFKLTVGVVKIYNSDEPLYCNEAIDILTVNNEVSNRYVAYNCMLEYSKYGTRTNNGITLNDDDKKKIKIFVPKDLENYSSLEIQEIIADFIEAMQNKIQKEFDRMDEGHDALKRLHKAYLARTFTLIDWEVK